VNRVRLSVKVIPSSSRDRIVGWHRNALKVKVKVQAPPEKGKANRAVAAHLAQWLGVPKNAVSVESGQSSGNPGFWEQGTRDSRDHNGGGERANRSDLRLMQ